MRSEYRARYPSLVDETFPNSAHTLLHYFHMRAVVFSLTKNDRLVQRVLLDMRYRTKKRN